jgi:multidrug resistance efflux pump
MKNSLAYIARAGVTLATVAIACIVGWLLWQHYELEPWTRDGRVKANVIQLAPDVGGQVTKMNVHDNEAVKAGQVLFEIDRARYELALQQAEAAEQARRVELAQAQKEAQRNAQLGNLVATEVREQGNTHVDEIRAALAQAVANHATAKLNLDRTRVIAPANGYVTNLDLYSGGYVTAGRPVMALVDLDSFYVEGYFEETKLQHIHIGDTATVRLMGSKQVISGHVQSFAGGIVDRDRSTGTNLLPNINPTFNWVRLAQRIPVRIALDKVPADVRLVVGQTATVDVRGNTKDEQKK